jgi:S-formylglutathione hydrolase
MTLALVSENRSFGGWHRRYRHASSSLGCEMVFAVYLPPQAETGPVPVLYWLSGLTCTDENFMQKAGAQRVAAELGIAIVAPDTSPRGPGVPGDPDGAWDFGLGAGFYVDATQAPWSTHYRMHDYVVNELPALVEGALPLLPRRGISGHSMGGHGALVAALRNPGRYLSVSAFAPITHPSTAPGATRPSPATWATTARLARLGRLRAHRHRPRAPAPAGRPGRGRQLPRRAAQARSPRSRLPGRRPPLQLHRHPGYDHSYYFIASFIEAHLRHHAAALNP